jgi:hypothetical protein
MGGLQHRRRGQGREQVCENSRTSAKVFALDQVYSGGLCELRKVVCFCIRFYEMKER